MNSRTTLFLITALCLSLCSNCGGGPSGFSGETVKMLLGAGPITLEAEQLMLNTTQVDCGLRADLWEPPRQSSAERSTASLTANGRALNFEDVVMIKDPGYRQPYVQVRGKFTVRPIDVVNITDGPPGTKLAQTKVGVVVAHPCFPQPLPLMGVRQGKFNQDTPPVFQFHLEGERWVLDRIRH